MMLIITASTAVYATDKSLDFTVEQVVNAPAASEYITFSYSFKPLDYGNPMPPGSTDEGFTFTITGNSKKNIGLPNFERQGSYRYELRNANGEEEPGFTYDKRTYIIEVHVDESLNTGIVVLNEGGFKIENIMFEGSYDPPTTTTHKPPQTPAPIVNYAGGKTPKTGDDMNAGLYIALLAASGILFIWLAAGLKKKKRGDYKS